MMNYTELANRIIETVKPDKLLRDKLTSQDFSAYKRVFVISVGKAGWLMAKTASEVLNDRIYKGFVVTKYGHSLGSIDHFEIYEAAHPITDENGINACERVLQQCSNLDEDDCVIFLLSGGASALFESSLLPLERIAEINSKLLLSGASIEEINTIRKRLSKVKGGKLAKHLAPAKVFNYILCDVVSQKLDVVGSGPCTEDFSTMQQAYNIMDKYNLHIEQLEDTVHKLDNVETDILGSVSVMANNSQTILTEMGYQAIIVDSKIELDMDDYLKLVIGKSKEYQNSDKKTALLFAGEPTLKVSKTSGLGGRCSHLVASMITVLKEMDNTTVISFGSDGTDGPTDGAGGYCDNTTYSKCHNLEINVEDYLNNFDSYTLLKKIDQLIVTGATNTNVNDMTIVLIDR